MRRGDWLDPALAERPFAEVAAAWLKSNPHKKPTTYACDAAAIRVHLLRALGELRIGPVRPSDIRAVVEGMRVRGLGSRATRTNYGVLRAILDWAVTNDITDRSPGRGIRMPDLTAVKPPVVSADKHHGHPIEGTGKTPNSNRTFSAPQAVLDELAAHLARTGRTSPEELVLQAPGGGSVRATNFRYLVYTPALEATGLDGLTFHRLRHSAGHMMRAVGVSFPRFTGRGGCGDHAAAATGVERAS